MEANKDEAERCLQKAFQYFKDGDIKKAQNLLLKSHAMYPAMNSHNLFENGKFERKNDNESKSEFLASSQGNNSDNKEIARIRKCKNFYEVLEVPFEASADQVKAAYRKLLLQVHPDKNDTPGADNAFQRVKDAYKTLSDPMNRRYYDSLLDEINYQKMKQRSTPQPVVVQKKSYLKCGKGCIIM